MNALLVALGTTGLGLGAVLGGVRLLGGLRPRSRVAVAAAAIGLYAVAIWIRLSSLVVSNAVVLVVSTAGALLLGSRLGSVGDLVVAGALFHALGRAGCPAGSSAAVLATSMSVALAAGWMTSGIPAIPFLAFGTVVCLARRSAGAGRGPADAPS